MDVKERIACDETDEEGVKEVKRGAKRFANIVKADGGVFQCFWRILLRAYGMFA